jgi:hypothetical protein
MLSPASFRRIYRISAWYDLIVTWPYATPVTLAGLWSLVQNIHSWAALPAIPELTVLGMMLGNFCGTVVLIWSVLRLRLNDPTLARYDAVGRWAFSAWMGVALWNGATPILWGFLVVELCFAVLQSLPVRRD